MNIDQIQANKPDGATHYRNRVLTDGFIYYRILDKKLYCYSIKISEWVEAGRESDLEFRHNIKPL